MGYKWSPRSKQHEADLGTMDNCGMVLLVVVDSCFVNEIITLMVIYYAFI